MNFNMKRKQYDFTTYNPVVLHSYTSQWLPRYPIMQAYAVTATSYYDVLIHAAKTTWDVCSQISQPSRQWLLKALLNFNFQCLQDVSEAIPVYSFMLFLWWLRESVSISDIPTRAIEY